MLLPPTLPFILASLGTVLALPAQFCDRVGGSPTSRFGEVMAPAGDVNADGVGDVIVTAQGEDRVYVICGGSGVDLYSVDVPSLGSGVSAESIGDLDLDGVADFAVGSPRARTVGVYSGASGALISPVPGQQTLTDFGRNVGVVGDLDLDSVPDLLVSADRMILGFSGASRAELFRYAIPGNKQIDAVGIGDLDADARPEIAVTGAPGSILSWDGVSVTVMASFASLGAVTEVASIGDIDGDGFGDVAFGAPESGPTKEGAAFVVSSAKASVLYSAVGAAALGELGSCVAPGGDINGDGVPDVIVCAKGTASARVYSGWDWCVLRDYRAGSWLTPQTVDAVSLGDGKNDDVPDIALGFGAGSGRVLVFAGDECQPNLGIHSSFARLRISGRYLVFGGSRALLSLSGAAINSPVLLIYGPASVPTSFLGQQLVPFPPRVLSLGATSVYGSFCLPLRGGGSSLATIYIQTAILDSLSMSVTLSNELAVGVGI